MPYTVKIDKSSCQSSGNCIEAAPEAFAWDADDLGDALPAAAALPRERLVAIVRRCPALCITVVDPDGRELEP